MVIVLPAPEGTKPAYRMLVIDDSEKAFPGGESRVLPLVAVETAIQAGEHRLPVHPGKITNVPPVTKRDEFNMAQTNFYYQQGEAWVVFTEASCSISTPLGVSSSFTRRRVPSNRRSPPSWTPCQL